MKIKVKKLRLSLSTTFGTPQLEDDDDINEHLTTLKKYWEHLNLVDDNNFKIPEVQFKIQIVSLLPPSWDNFTRPYISIHKGDSINPKLMVTSQELIGVLKEEYIWWQRRTGKLPKEEVVHQTNLGKPSFLGWMQNAECCGHCGLRNHKTKDCRFLGQTRWGICNCFSHATNECYSKKVKGLKQKREKGDTGKGKKKRKRRITREKKRTMKKNTLHFVSTRPWLLSLWMNPKQVNHLILIIPMYITTMNMILPLSIMIGWVIWQQLHTSAISATSSRHSNL